MPKKTDTRYLTECLDHYKTLIPEGFSQEIEKAICELIYLRGLNSAFTEVSLRDVEDILCPPND